MSFKTRSMEILELMRAMEPGTAFHGPELMLATGFSRALVTGSLVWLEDAGAVKLHIDVHGRSCWSVVADELDDTGLTPTSVVGVDNTELLELGLGGDTWSTS